VPGLARLHHALRSVGSASDLFVVRLPELVSLSVARRAREVGATLISFVVADPKGMRFVLPGPLGVIVGHRLAGLTRRALERSSAVVYVTQNWMQQLFPAPRGVPTLGRSNVTIPPTWVAPADRRPPGAVVRLIEVGSHA